MGQLLHDMQLALDAQPATRSWTARETRQAARLVAELRLDWQAHCVRHHTMSALEQLSARLDVAACTILRARLEAIRQHLAYLLHDAAMALEAGDLPGTPPAVGRDAGPDGGAGPPPAYAGPPDPGRYNPRLFPEQGNIEKGFRDICRVLAVPEE